MLSAFIQALSQTVGVSSKTEGNNQPEKNPVLYQCLHRFSFMRCRQRCCRRFRRNVMLAIIRSVPERGIQYYRYSQCKEVTAHSKISL